VLGFVQEGRVQAAVALLLRRLMTAAVAVSRDVWQADPMRLSATGSASDLTDPAGGDRRKLADLLATELQQVPADRWPLRTLPETARLDENPRLAAAVTLATDAVGAASPATTIAAADGVDGPVVTVHGPAWSLVGRCGGPVLILTNASATVWRVDGDSRFDTALACLVGDLLAAAGYGPG